MKNIFRTILLAIFTLVAISLLSNVKAASTAIKPSKNSANVGDKVTVNVTVNATTWNLKVTGPGISENIKGYNLEGLKNMTTTKTITLDTSSVGTKTITLTGDITDETGQITDGINKSVSVVVNEKPATPPPASTTTPSNNNSGSGSNNNNQNNNNTTSKKSSDTSLKSITVGGNSYKIGDTMTVNSDTSSIDIQAVAKSSKASVSGNGVKELVTGTNKFTIKVTAEDGTTKNYSITVIREEYVEDNPNIEDPDYQNQTQDLRLTSLVIQGIELTPNFSSDIFSYSAYIINEDKLEIEAISNIEDAKVEIVGNTNLVEGENTVLVKLTKDDTTVEYKIIVNKSIVQDDSEKENQKVGFIGWITDWWNNSGSTIIVFTIILILLGAAAIFAVTSYKYSNNVKEVSKHEQSQTDYVEDIYSKQEK